ncbi:MAG: hypothetical protein VKO26_08780 [Cyanobacteriota bacterium]|nr:hypothetical protein [Cyanobacteriota bacterium]
MDDAAWSRCPLEAERLEAERLEAERLLEASRPVRDRNRQGFTLYPPQGASLERNADELKRQRLAGICPGDR